MATRGPWSVKGIESNAREAALQAARSEGVTLGDYLNRILLEAEAYAPDQGQSGGDVNTTSDDDSGEEGADGTAAIEQLVRRIEAAEVRATLAISGMDQSVKGIVSRIEESETSQIAMESRIEMASDELSQAQDYLKRRIDRLEADDASEQSLRALKSLEGALERLSGRVQDAEDKSNRVQTKVSSRLDGLKTRLDNVTNRVDASLEDVASKVERAVSEAELKAEGATRHLSERVSQVEVDIAETSRTVSDRVERVEQRVGSTLDRVSDNIESFGNKLAEHDEKSAGTFDLVNKLKKQSRQHRNEVNERLDGMDVSFEALTERLSQAETLTDTALAGLENSFNELDDRMSHFAEDGVQNLRQEFEDRLKSVKDELATTVAATRADLAQQIEEASVAPTEAFAEMSNAVSELHKRFRRSEQRQTQAVEAIGEEVAQLTDTLEKRVRNMEERNESELSSGLRDQLNEFATVFQKRLAEFESKDTGASAETVGAKLNEMAEKLNKRVEESEERSASAIRDFTDHVTTLTKNLQAKQDENISKLSDEIKASEGRQKETMTTAFNQVNDRIAQVEEATSATVSPIQKAMASLAERLQSIEEFSNPGGVASSPIADVNFDKFEDRLGKSDIPEPAPTETPAKAEKQIVPSIPDEDELDDPWGDDNGAFEQTESLGADIIEDHDEVVADLPSESYNLDEAEYDEPPEFLEPQTSPASDYLTRAREAARASQETRKSSGKSKSVKRSSKNSGSKLPLIAAASVLALSAVGTAGFMMMRGKQDAGLDYLSVGATEGSVDENSLLMPEAGDEITDDTLIEDDEILSGQTLESVEEPAPKPAEKPDVEEARAEPTARTEPPQQQAAVTQAPQERLEEIETTQTLNEAQVQRVAQRPQAQPPAQVPVSVPQEPTPVQKFQTGLTLLESGRIADGARLIREAADSGVVMAQYRLAKLYETGQGVPRDLAQSREWTAKAAEAGNVKAMHDLAVFFANGEGGPLNYAGAVQWFRNAAEYGLVDSQFNLGVLYEEGMGVTANAGEALHWYAVAERMGDSGATPKVSTLSATLDPVLVDEVLAKAATYQPRPSDPVANAPIAPAAGASAAQARPAASSAPDRSAQATLIGEAQTLLNELGYNVGVPDGLFGTQTRNAVLSFQMANGYPQSAQVTPTLLRQLQAARAGL